jgi:hypothetical protein
MSPGACIAFARLPLARWHGHTIPQETQRLDRAHRMDLGVATNALVELALREATGR